MTPKWILDTNSCIAVMNQSPVSVRHQLTKHSVDAIGISAISLYELEYGIKKSKKQARNRKTLHGFCKYIQIYPWDGECAIYAGLIRAALEKNGNLIGPYDILIAAHAMALGATLVTHNTKEFKRVGKLKVVDWVSK